MNDIQAPLLGETIQRHPGDVFFNKIESIRQLAIQARNGQLQSKQTLIEIFRQLPDDELLPVAKAFNPFFNLANIAEQYDPVKRRR